MNRFKQLRLKRGLRQTELSEKLGITQAAISYIESNKMKMSPHLAAKACRILQFFDDPELFYEEADPNEK